MAIFNSYVKLPEGKSPSMAGESRRPNAESPTECRTTSDLRGHSDRSQGAYGIYPPVEDPSGKPTKNYGKSPCLMGKSTISMVIFHSYVNVYQRVTMVNHDQK